MQDLRKILCYFYVVCLIVPTVAAFYGRFEQVHIFQSVTDVSETSQKFRRLGLTPPYNTQSDTPQQTPHGLKSCGDSFYISVFFATILPWNFD